MSRKWTPLWIAVAMLVTAAAAHAAEFSKIDPRARIALAGLRAGNSVQDMRAAQAAVTEDGNLDVFIRGTVSRSQLEALGVTVQTALPGLYTASVPPGVVEALAARADVISIRGSVPVETNLDVSVPATGASVLRGAGPTFTGLNGAGVLVGDVDTGLDFDHGDFRTAGNLTRCITIWDQTIAAVNPPAPYTYGREWTQAEINGGVCTETDPSSGGGHGTHVMGIEAGDGSQTGGPTPPYTYVGMAPMADIIEVKTDLSTTHILDGVAYFMAKATSLGENAVCNLSLGSQFGPHDGTSDFESGLSALTGPGHIICVSAGNDRGTNLHAELFATAQDSAKMTIAGISSTPASGNPNVAIDGYYAAGDQYDVALRAPNGTLIGPISLGNINAAYPGTVITGVGRVYIENGAFLTATGDREIYFEMSRTASTSTPNGVWTFIFTPVSVTTAGRIDMWKYYNASSSTSSIFSFHNVADGLVSEPGNANEVITTAAWETKNGWVDCGNRSVVYSAPAPLGAIATFSSPGPTRDGRNKPDIAAPGMGIASARSFDYTITCPANPNVSALLNDLNHIINQGTSMASPHTAGAAALLMQKFGALTPSQVKTYLNSHATLDGFTGVPWNSDFGYGKLHLGDLLNPTVSVVAPNGAEVFIIGTTNNLRWSATDNVGVTLVDLYLSRNGVGGPWETIVTGIANSGSYSWVATGPATGHAILKVVAHDAEANLGSDLSDNEWTIIDQPTATLLSRFVAKPLPDGVELRWQFTDATLNTRAIVERAEAQIGPWTRPTVDSRTDGEEQVAVDHSALAGHDYWYRLMVTDHSGKTNSAGMISAGAGESFDRFALSRVAPNPSNGVTNVEFTVPSRAAVRITVLDVQGRTVAELANGTFSPGRYQALWTGQANGHDAHAGLYFIRMDAPGARSTKRLVLNR